MAIKITEECINCGACEPECPNTAIYEGGVDWELAGAHFGNGDAAPSGATGFYSTDGLGKDQVRVAYVLESGALKKAIKCLEEGLKAYRIAFPDLSK